MTLKQLTDALLEGKKVGVRWVGRVYVNAGGQLVADDMDGSPICSMVEDQIIGEIFRRHKECVVFPEEGP